MATEANAELIRENQKELAGFASGEINDISPVLERVLQEVRSTGVLCYSWPHVKVLLDAKLKTAMDFVQALDKSSAPTLGMGWGSPTNKARPDERRTNISELLNTFEGPPFTLQRLTEVIMEPHKFYKSLNKLINALEKLLAVSSTLPIVDPFAIVQPDADTDEVMQPTISATVKPPVVQTVQGNAELDIVARAPWSGSEQ